MKNKAVIVYQGGLANVFKVKSFNMADYGRDAKRLLQADFRACINFAHGLAAAGWIVRTAGCNQAGDITHAHWTEDIDSLPFRDKIENISINN